MSTLQKRNFHYGSQITGREDGIVEAWIMDISGQSVDGTVNGLNGSVINIATNSEGFLGVPAIEFDPTYNNSRLDVADNDLLDQEGEQTWIFWFKTDTDNKGIMEKNTAQLISIAAGRLNWGTSAGFKYSPGDYDDDKWYFVALTFDGTVGGASGADGLAIHIDGVPAPDEEVVGTFTGFTSNGTTMRIGNRRTINIAFGGKLAEFALFDKVLSKLEIQNLYKRYAKLPVLLDDFSDYIVSLTDESAILLSDSIWRFADNEATRISVSSSYPYKSTQKVINCVGNSSVYTESNTAYGTWEWEWLKGADATAPNVIFIADVPGRVNDSGMNGYSITLGSDESISFDEITNGSTTTLWQSSGSVIDYDEWYTYRVVRRFDDLFTIFIKGGAYTQWTRLGSLSGSNPVEDGTHTTSKYINLDLTAGSEFTNLKVFWGALDPTG